MNFYVRIVDVKKEEDVDDEPDEQIKFKHLQNFAKFDHFLGNKQNGKETNDKDVGNVPKGSGAAMYDDKDDDIKSDKLDLNTKKDLVEIKSKR